MKTFVNILMASLVIVSLALAISCTQQKEPPSPESKTHGATTTGPATAFEDYCTDCHEGARALGRARQVDEWKAVTRKMSQFRESRTGEGIPQDAQDEIIDYLMKQSR